MCAAMLCGDEVASCVVDIGGAFTKVGSAGQDSPHHVYRSDVGVVEREQIMGEGLETSFIVGDSGLRVPRKNMEIRSPYTSQGTVVAIRLSDFVSILLQTVNMPRLLPCPKYCSLSLLRDASTV